MQNSILSEPSADGNRISGLGQGKTHNQLKAERAARRERARNFLHAGGVPEAQQAAQDMPPRAGEACFCPHCRRIWIA